MHIRQADVAAVEAVGELLVVEAELGFNVVENPVHVHDVQATILHLLGLNHTQLTYRFQDRDYRLTDVRGKVVESILST